MRQLSVTLIEWQDEVVRVQKTYHQKFEKAKEVVNKVRIFHQLGLYDFFNQSYLLKS